MPPRTNPPGGGPGGHSGSWPCASEPPRRRVTDARSARAYVFTPKSFPTGETQAGLPCRQGCRAAETGSRPYRVSLASTMSALADYLGIIDCAGDGCKREVVRLLGVLESRLRLPEARTLTVRSLCGMAIAALYLFAAAGLSRQGRR